MDWRQKKIYNEIKNNIRIGWADLYRIVKKEKIASERTFRIILNDLVDRGIVYKDEVGKGHTQYYVDKEWKDIEKRTFQTFKKELPDFRKSIKHIRKFKNKLPDDVLASYFVMLWKTCNHLEFKSMLLIGLSKNERIVDLEDFAKLKQDLVELSSRTNLEKSLDMLVRADAYLQYETDEMKKAFREDWKSRDLPFPDKK